MLTTFLLREFARATAAGLVFLVALSLGASTATGQDRRASVVEAGGTTQAAVPGKRIALVIGNSRYATRPLANAQHDAADVAARLQALGFDVVHLQDLDQAGMRRAVREFQLRTPSADVALFFFAGHGSQEHSRNYLWPIGAQPREIDDAEDELLPLNRVLDAMEGRARTSIVILDACRDAPLTGKARSNSRSSLAMDPQREGALIVYAAAPNKTASDGDGRNGVFTAAFLKALAGQDLSFNGVLRTTLEAMVADAKSKGQTPYVNGSELLRQRFRFDVTVEPGPQLREGQFWDSIKTSGDIADFEAYVKRYPKGEFVDLAANAIRRLKELQGQQQQAAQRERERAEEGRKREEEQKRFASSLEAERKAREAAEARLKVAEREASEVRAQRAAAEAAQAAAIAARQPANPSPAPVSAPSTVQLAPAPATATLLEGRYEILGDGSEVKDHQTQLIWQRCNVGQRWDGTTCLGMATKHTFDQAQALAGNGWRVPSIRELHSLIWCSNGKTKLRAYLSDGGPPLAHWCDGAPGKDYQIPTIRSSVFPITPHSIVWSGSPRAGNSSDAGYVDFNGGGSGLNYDRSGTNSVRLVRGGQ